MAELKLGTQIGGNLVWHQGILDLNPVDDISRGVLNSNKGTVRSQVYEFSATEGGAIVYSATAALNFI